MALQHYTSRVVVPLEEHFNETEGSRIPTIFLDAEVVALPDPVWPNADPMAVFFYYYSFYFEFFSKLLFYVLHISDNNLLELISKVFCLIYR